MDLCCIHIEQPDGENDVILQMSENANPGYQESDQDRVMKSLDQELIDICFPSNIEAVQNLLKIRINENDATNVGENDPGHMKIAPKDYYKFIDFLIYDFKDVYQDSLLEIVKASLINNSFEEAFGSVLVIAANKCYKIIQESTLNKLKELGDGKITHCLNSLNNKKQAVLTQIILSLNEKNNETESISVLMKYKQYFDIDSQDFSGNTALHYTVQEERPLYHTLTKTLIKNGARMNVENSEGISVIDIIPPNTIEDILDECIEELSDYPNDRKNESYQLKMDLSTFSHRESLGTRNESEFIRALHSSEFHKHLLYHPLTTIFLHMKWQKVKHIWYLNMLFNMGFFLLIFIYIYLYRDLLVKGNIENDMGLFTLKMFIYAIALVMLIREIGQLYCQRKDYIQSFENYLEVSIIGLTYAMLYTEAINHQPKIVAWLVVFISVEFLLLLEKMHQQKMSIYISMFRKVTYNFVKLAIILIIILIGFAVSFYLLIPISGGLLNEMNEQNETQNGNKSEKYPSTFNEVFFKTLIMSTGEYDHSSLDFTYFPASRLLFSVFIFAILLVALNLLNGIAISDIQAILNDANKYHIEDQMECLFHIEKFQPIYDWLHFRTLWEKGQIFRCFPDKVIITYPNKYEGLEVMCCGHEDFWNPAELIYIKCFKLCQKNIKRCENCKAMKNLRCNGCGEGRKRCKDCIVTNDEDEHKCVSKHTYIIPSEYIMLAKQNKEELQRKKLTEDALKHNKIIEEILKEKLS